MKLLIAPEKHEELLKRGTKLEALMKKLSKDILQDIQDMQLTTQDVEDVCEKVHKRHEDDNVDRRWDIVSSRQLINIEIGDSHNVFAEAGHMVYKSGNIQTTVDHNNVGGFLLKILANQAITHYSGKGIVGFAGDTPGEIALMHLEHGDTIYGMKNSFVAAIGNVDYALEIANSPIRSALLGEGVLMMKFSCNAGNNGLVFFHAIGGWEIINLRKDRTIKVEAGSVVAWESTVTHKIVYEGLESGLKGEGAFMNELTGPGKIIIQPLALDKLKLNIGDTICLGPPPIIVWQVLQRKFKQVLYGFFRG